MTLGEALLRISWLEAENARLNRSLDEVVAWSYEDMRTEEERAAARRETLIRAIEAGVVVPLPRLCDGRMRVGGGTS